MPLLQTNPALSRLPFLCLVRKSTQPNCYQRNFLPNPASGALVPCPGTALPG
jgi:hypothetical protein